MDSIVNDNFALYHGDCVEVLRQLPSASVHYSVFSPPFSSLYTYSNSPRDIGNVRNDAEFFAHFGFVVDELLRVLRPGRLVSMHTMLLPTSKERDGYIGLRDFRGDLIRAFQARGFAFHSEVVIWKDPVTAMQRTKALGLLHKTVRENASMSRQGVPDYVITMRAPGEVPRDERVTHDAAEYPVAVWQNVASPVWMDINPSDTLQHRSAREHDDERHICPLQLEVIRRCVELWTNPGEVVLSPFAGIGSEGHIALGGTTTRGAKLKPRRFVGVELKRSYYEQAALNLSAAVRSREAVGLFDSLDETSDDPPDILAPVASVACEASVDELPVVDTSSPVAAPGDAFTAADGPVFGGPPETTTKRARKPRAKRATEAT